MAVQTKGFCKYCGKEYTAGGILRHLPACPVRRKRLEEEKGKNACGYYMLSVKGKWDKTYWIILEISENATLENLDRFLRDIWLECCGHLSAFTIEGIQYEIQPNEDWFWGAPPKSMKYKLKTVLYPEAKFFYEYDFGSTTELELRVVGYRTGRQKKEKITLLSRNNPPEILCGQCGKNPAQWIEEGYYFERSPFWCEECLKKAEEEEADSDEIYVPEMLLPVCNSPRMGVCGYEGSTLYPDQFEPDTDGEAENRGKGKKRAPEKTKAGELTKKLYETALRIKELKPWDSFWDRDLICLQDGKEEEAAWVSILGRGGDCYGIVVYEGHAGLNDFFMLATQEELGIPQDYAMFSQNNLTCYWGSRKELSQKERKQIRDMGYKFRGENQWLYFRSFRTKFYPAAFSPEETAWMLHYMELLEKALKKQEEEKISVAFDQGKCLCFRADEKTGSASLTEASLPFAKCRMRCLVVADEEYRQELRSLPRQDGILEIDIRYVGEPLAGEGYDRPVHPVFSIVAEQDFGTILDADMIGPEKDEMVEIANYLVEFMEDYGAPEEIRVCNRLLEANLEDICELTGTKLRRVKRLPSIEKFIEDFKKSQR